MGKKSEITDKKICTKCGSEMKVREKRSGDDAGKKFWVCLKYPDCKSVEIHDVIEIEIKNSHNCTDVNSDDGTNAYGVCNKEESSKICDDIGESASRKSNVSAFDNDKLYKCPACSSVISKNAKACTKCGEPNPSIGNHKFKIVIAVAMVLGIAATTYIGKKNFAFSKTTSQNFEFSKTTSQSRKFCSDVIRYKDRLEDQCQTACGKYACDIDDYLRDGYKIVSSSPNQIPVDIVTPYGDITGKCTCVGTEYILEK